MALLEVHVPVRPAAEGLERTIDSLLRQTTRTFAVVLSGDPSAANEEAIVPVLARLREGGIEATRLNPPRPMERLEHWNWLHAGSEASWVKPLLPGDALAPECLAALLAALAAHPEAGLACTGFLLHGEGEPPKEVRPAGFRPPAVMKGEVLRHGDRFGPPSACAFSSEAFRAVGGYRPALPLAASGLLCCTLAARFGVVTLPAPLCQLSPAGASAAPRRGWRREALTCHGLLLYHAWTEQEPIPWLAAVRHLARAGRPFPYEP